MAHDGSVGSASSPVTVQASKSGDLDVLDAVVRREGVVCASDGDEGGVGEVCGDDGTIGECSFRQGCLGGKEWGGEEEEEKRLGEHVESVWIASNRLSDGDEIS